MIEFHEIPLPNDRSARLWPAKLDLEDCKMIRRYLAHLEDVLWEDAKAKNKEKDDA